MRFYVPTEGPQDWRLLLADPDKHWVRGRSARTLAHCWEDASGLPPEVAAAVEASPYEELHDLKPLMAFPEHKVPLPGGTRASQTDVMVLATSKGYGLIAVAVEGKVDESFDRPVRDWLGGSPSPGQHERLRYLCDLLRIPEGDADDTPYQLLHRTASALIQTDDMRGDAAVMLVHTWGGLAGFGEYADFVSLLGGQAESGKLTLISRLSPPLYLGWVQGDPRWLEA